MAQAKELCPNLIAQHVATWKEGEDKWAYRDKDAEGKPLGPPDMATHKVSLDPYRLESRRILALIKESLPKNMQKVEKASVDEVYLDLSAHVHSVLLERFPHELGGPPPYDDPTERLPMPPVTALDWKADALIDLHDDDDQGSENGNGTGTAGGKGGRASELDDPDWDDVAILVGSEIVRDVRQAVRDKLRYTCSAGVAGNKTLAKLGSAHKKPNQQTVIRSRAVGHFLSGFKFTKIRLLGGKLGESIVERFGTDTVSDLLKVPVEQLQQRLGEHTGVWVYNIIRGVDASEVNPRTQIKSMLSAKSFRPSIGTFDQAEKWLRIFTADIFARLVEEGVLTNKRRPKTINLHYRQGAQTRSRSSPIPQGRQLDEKALFDLAKHLLSQIVSEGHVWPCSNLSLSVGGFEDGVTGNMGIGAFLLKGEEAQAVNKAAAAAAGCPRTASMAEHGGGNSSDEVHHHKRRRVDTGGQGGGGGGIQRFFVKKGEKDAAACQQGSNGVGLGSDGAATKSHGGETSSKHHHSHKEPTKRGREDEDQGAAVVSGEHESSKGLAIPEGPWARSPTTDEIYQDENAGPKEANHGATMSTGCYMCPRCNASLECSEAEIQSHMDWHFAKELQEQEKQERVLERARERQQQQEQQGGRGDVAFVNRQATAAGGASTSASRSSRNGSHHPQRASGGASSASAAGAAAPRRGRPKKIEAGQSKLRFG